METKKILVPFDLQNPDKKINGFLYPNINLEQIDTFHEINKGKEWKTGMIVLVNQPITTNDVFAKIVDSGKKINSVNDLLNHIENYLEQVSKFKIGDIIGIEPLNNSFKLIKMEKPPRRVAKLP